MADDPTTGELERLIKSNHTVTTSSITKLETQLGVAVQQMTLQLKDYLLREVWQTERDAQREQIRDIKDEVTSARRRAANAVWAAVGSLAGSLALIAFKGGH